MERQKSAQRKKWLDIVDIINILAWRAVHRLRYRRAVHKTGVPGRTKSKLSFKLRQIFQKIQLTLCARRKKITIAETKKIPAEAGKKKEIIESEL